MCRILKTCLKSIFSSEGDVRGMAKRTFTSGSFGSLLWRKGCIVMRRKAKNKRIYSQGKSRLCEGGTDCARRKTTQKYNSPTWPIRYERTFTQYKMKASKRSGTQLQQDGTVYNRQCIALRPNREVSSTLALATSITTATYAQMTETKSKTQR